MGLRDRRALVRELARSPSGVCITCAGRSMEPTVRPGQRLQVIAAGRPRIGEVVLFETADRRDLVLHRVVLAAPGAPWFWHIGDAGSPEGPARAHVRQLIGRALLPRRRPALADLVAIAAAAARELRRRGCGRLRARR
jgi:hypothetical protein